MILSSTGISNFPLLWGIAYSIERRMQGLYDEINKGRCLLYNIN